MVHYILLFALFLTLKPVFGQDERYFRQILRGEHTKMPNSDPYKVVQDFVLRGKAYKVDLDGDKIEETIQPLKKDGVDWIEIRNASENILFTHKLFAMGGESSLYKIKLVNLSTKVKALILFLDEGGIQGRHFESTARIYLISYENNDLTSMKFAEGPHFYQEREAVRDQYWRRTYQVNVFDTDSDGIREIAIQYNHIQRIMIYKGSGEWKQF